MVSKAIAATIRDLRKMRGMTQEELGAEVGLSQERISNIERGNHGCSLTLPTLDKFARALSVELIVKFKIRLHDF